MSRGCLGAVPGPPGDDIQSLDTGPNLPEEISVGERVKLKVKRKPYVRYFELLWPGDYTDYLCASGILWRLLV